MNWRERRSVSCGALLVHARKTRSSRLAADAAISKNPLIVNFDQCAITFVKEGDIAITGSQAKPIDSRSNYSSGGGFSIRGFLIYDFEIPEDETELQLLANFTATCRRTRDTYAPRLTNCVQPNCDRVPT
jgi:hypothetical protein